MTNRLTADRSTTELLRNNIESSISYTFKDSCSLDRPRIQEQLKNEKPKDSFGTLGTLRTPYPLFYRKKVTIAIPFASPESVSETKGGGQPSPWSSPLSSPRCIAYWSIDFHGAAILPFAKCILTGNKNLSIFANNKGPFFLLKASG